MQDLAAQKKRELEYSGFFDSYYYRGPIAITVGGGLVGYMGDLDKGFPSKSFSPVFSLGANYKVWPRTVFGAEFSFFNLKAEDTTATVNAAFKSTNLELDLYGRFYFIDDIVRVAADRTRKPRRLKPYVTLGIGAIHYSTTTTFGPISGIDSSLAVIDSNTTPRITGAVPASGFALVIPLGLGLSYSFSHRVSLMGEVTYKYALSDNLDGISILPAGLSDSYYMFQLKLQLAPWAPKVKKKRRKGHAPQDNSGGSTESPNTPTEKPKAEEATPAEGQETPPAEAPAQETPPTETPAPAQETPAQDTQEGDGWDKPAKPADTK